MANWKMKTTTQSNQFDENKEEEKKTNNNFQCSGTCWFDYKPERLEAILDEKNAHK